jgi:hypothetical protein
MGDLGCSLALSRGSTVLTQESSKASPAKAAGSLQGITVTADRQGASLDTLSVAPWFLPLASRIVQELRRRQLARRGAAELAHRTREIDILPGKCRRCCCLFS